jgi:SAM-dependent methyltransferase
MAEAAEWIGDLGRKWAARIEAMDRQLAPCGTVGLAELGPRPGERILDLGCGGGPTTLPIADAVGPGGHVTGADISPDLLAIARRRAAGRGNVDFIEADAGLHRFTPPPYDALFSRFGCMFFADPVAAFVNLRGALRPGARAVMVVWNDPKANPWAMVPARVAAEFLGPAEPMAPGAPGPFGWADPGIFGPILRGAGFSDVAWRAAPVEMEMGEGDDPDPVARAVSIACRIGPLGRRLADAPEGAEARLRPRLAEEFARYVRDGAVRVPGLLWVVTARA